MFEKNLHPKEGFSQVVSVEPTETITLHVSVQIGSGKDLERPTIETLKILKLY